MALNTNALTLLATAKDHLDIPVADLTEDSKVERLINTASQFIENFCKRKLVNATYTQYIDGRASNRILLKEWPVTGGASTNGKPEVFIDNSSIFGAGSEIDDVEYDVASNIEIVRIGCARGNGSIWPKGQRNIKVIYDAGLGTTGTMPSDIEQACLDYVLWLYDMGSDRRVGRNTKTKGDESVSFETRLPPHIELILEPYVRSDFYSEIPVGVMNR